MCSKLFHRSFVIDYEIVRLPLLTDLLSTLNQDGCEVVSVTQDSLDRYTVFFRRPFHG